MIIKWAIIAVVGVALLGAVMGVAASLSLSGVDDLGFRSAKVNPPCASATVPCPSDSNVGVSDVEWVLNFGGTCGDSNKVSHVVITMESLSATTAFDIIRFQLGGAGGTVLAHSSTAFDGDTYNGLEAGHVFEWDLTAVPTSPAGCVDASAITSFSITVVDEN